MSMVDSEGLRYRYRHREADETMVMAVNDGRMFRVTIRAARCQSKLYIIIYSG